VLENYIKEDFLFCKPTDGRAMSLEEFDIINHFLEENEIKWDKSTGLHTDRAHSMSGLNVGLQALVRKRAPHII
jgi:hypothetical protein